MGRANPNGRLGGPSAWALVALPLVGAVGSALYHREIAMTLRRLAHRVWPPPERPAHPPIEKVARDARRLRAEWLALADGTPMARRRGLTQAYDDLLALACEALNVPDTLTGLEPGTDRDAERLRVEHELETAGLRLRG